MKISLKSLKSTLTTSTRRSRNQAMSQKSHQSPRNSNQPWNSIYQRKKFRKLHPKWRFCTFLTLPSWSTLKLTTKLWRAASTWLNPNTLESPRKPEFSRGKFRSNRKSICKNCRNTWATLRPSSGNLRKELQKKWASPIASLSKAKLWWWRKALATTFWWFSRI